MIWHKIDCKDLKYTYEINSDLKTVRKLLPAKHGGKPKYVYLSAYWWRGKKSVKFRLATKDGSVRQKDVPLVRIVQYLTLRKRKGPFFTGHEEDDLEFEIKPERK